MGKVRGKDYLFHRDNIHNSILSLFCLNYLIGAVKTVKKDPNMFFNCFSKNVIIV